MTTLLEVTIDGLAGRKDRIRYSLKRDVNIFFGLNGSGKTSLLKILHSGLDDDSGYLTRVAFNSASITFYSSSRKRSLERSISPGASRIQESEREYRAAFERALAESEAQGLPPDEAVGRARHRLEIGEWVTEPEAPGARIFTHGFLSTNRLLGDVPQRRYGIMTEEDLDTLFADQIVEVWRTYTNRVLSQVTQVQSDGLRDILRSLLFATPEPIEHSPPEVQKAYQRASHFLKRRPARQNSAEFLEFQRRFNEEPHFRGVVLDIDEIERRIEQAEEPRRRLAELISSFFSKGKTIKFSNTGLLAEVDGKQIPIASLSSGEKQLVRILIEVIIAEDNVIIIDEPELSMHIDWQRNLISAMRTVNPDVQIIMATHSPDIMENVSDECIFRL